jgi:predicted nucleic acid-binding protein
LKILKSGVRVVVADTNVLLSAISGRAARKALWSEIEVYTTEYTWSEVEEYLPYFIDRYDIPMAFAYQTLQSAPVEVKEQRFYTSQMPRAKEYMKERDPDDVDVAALALTLDAPVWSNDNHFKNFPTGRYTTAQLLKILGK